MYRSIKYQLLIVACFAIILAHSQKNTIVFDFVDEIHQLPSNSITDFYEDSEGNLWMAGLRGLIKYDGFKFTYSFLPADSNQFVIGDRLVSIAEDNKGRLWLGTLNTSLQYSDTQKSKFTTLSNKHLEGLSTTINDIAVDSMGRIFLGRR